MSNCKIDSFGTKKWHNDEGLLHRLDGPAIERADGYKSWYFEGKLHRIDGPAVEWPNGDKFWYFEDKLHRLDGPAVECVNGDKEWWVDGKLHRLDGPAVENGRVEYWEYGVQKFPRFRSIDSEFEVSCGL